MSSWISWVPEALSSISTTFAPNRLCCSRTARLSAGYSSRRRFARLSAGGRWTRTSSTRARSTWIVALDVVGRLGRRPPRLNAGKGSHLIGRRREMDSNHRFLGRQQGLRAVAWVGAAVTRAAKLAARLPFGLHPPLVLADPHLSVGCGGEWTDRGWVVPRGNDLDGECSVSRDHPIGRFCVQVDHFRHLVRPLWREPQGQTPAPARWLHQRSLGEPATIAQLPDHHHATLLTNANPLVAWGPFPHQVSIERAV